MRSRNLHATKVGSAQWFLIAAILVLSYEVRAQESADPDSIRGAVVEVVGQRDDGRHQTDGAGFFIGPRHILTHNHLVSFDRVAVVRLVEDGAEFSARVIDRDEFRNLALLEIDGHEGPTVALATGDLKVGQEIRVPRWQSNTVLDVEVRDATILTKRRVARRDSPDQPVNFFLHDRVGNSRDYGFPVYDRCGSVIGMQMADPDWRQGTSFWSKKPDPLPNPENWMHAISVDEIRQFSEPYVELNETQEQCPTKLELRQTEAEQAQLDAEAASQQAEEAARRAEEAETNRQVSEQERDRMAREAREAAQEAQAARLEAESLTEEAARREQEFGQQTSRLEEEAEALQDELERLRLEREQNSERVQLYLGLGIALILLLTGAIVFALHSKKKSLRHANDRLSKAERAAESARQAAKKAPRPASFGVNLKGTSGTGEPFALNISALSLGHEEGVKIGRSPDVCDYIIADEEVSREHLRLKVQDERLWIEDLGSVNGTMLNDTELESNDLYEAENGSEVRIGAVWFRLNIGEP